MDALAITVAAAALVFGLTGTWSPCGFSMIETIGPVGHSGGRPTTLAACLTFTIGALVGGVLTFGALAAIGGLVHGADDAIAYGVAAAIAIAAAIAELRGAAIVPQVRRQLPEHWRRLMPMPVAAGLYGILLGLGFTTFVLTFGVFALAGIVLAVGEPAVGLLAGLAFGIGRALPIAALAPLADRPLGIRATELMAERPAIYRGFRVGDGLALLAAAAALVVAVPASASRVETRPAADPAAGGKDLAFQRPDRSGYIRRGGRDLALPGRDPALGAGRAAVISGGEIAILSAADLEVAARVPAADADAVAISRRWLVWRARSRGRDFIRARNVADPGRPGPVKSLGSAGGASQLGRPSLDDNRLVYARATPRRNTIVKRLLGAKRKKRAKTTVIRSVTDGLSNPSIRGEVAALRAPYPPRRPAQDRRDRRPRPGADAALTSRGDAVVDRALGAARLRHPDPRHRAAPEDPLGRPLTRGLPARTTRVRVVGQATEGALMADAGLFIGWGQVVRGREQRAVEVFNEVVAYWGGLQGDGKIEDFEVVFLTPHGGDLAGFGLLRGSAEQMNALRGDEEFIRHVARADLIVESQGVVDAALGEGIAAQMAIYQEEVGGLD